MQVTVWWTNDGLAAVILSNAISLWYEKCETHIILVPLMTDLILIIAHNNFKILTLKQNRKIKDCYLALQETKFWITY